MTDKEKIRNEIERLMAELIQEKENGFGSDADDACILELQNVLTYIDSLQEEPVSEDLEKIVEEIAEPTILNAYGTKELVRRLRNTICGTSVSEELEEACEQLAENARKHKAETISPFFSPTDYKQGVIAGAEWQKKHLWRDAQGDDLPEIDREVIVLTQPYPLGENEYTVSFAHRPNPNGWDGKSITTGNIEHYTPKTYDKGGWNIPDIKWWLDVKLPKEIEL